MNKSVSWLIFILKCVMAFMNSLELEEGGGLGEVFSLHFSCLLQKRHKTDRSGLLFADIR